MTETVVRVRVDTSQARAGERQLERAKGRTQRLRDRAAKKLGIPTTKQAIGAVAGFRMLSRFGRVGVGNVDPWAVSDTEFESIVQLKALELTGVSLRANRNAREEAAEAFGGVADAEQRQALSRDYYEISKKIKTQEEKGLLIMQQTIVGPSRAALMKKALAGYLTLVQEGYKWMMGEMGEGK